MTPISEAPVRTRHVPMKAGTGRKARDRKVLLSTLWIFVVLNYLYADVIGLTFNRVLQPEAWSQLGSGYIGSIHITQGFVLMTAVLMETAIAMVLLSRILSYRPNRWANVGVGALQTAAVAWSMSGGDLNVFYAFFVIIEMVTTLFIIWYAWTWPKPETLPVPAGQEEDRP
jgi:uncharacterized protein DUF6326